MAEDDPGQYPQLPQGSTWTVARVFFPAGNYRHPPTGLVQLRVVRRGSSYAEIDLGLGARRVFTRPGDLLVSLPDRATSFGIEDGRELTLVQVTPEQAGKLLRECGATGLDDLVPLLRRPTRDALVAEIVRRLESGEPDTAAARQWALGLVFANLLRVARKLASSATPVALQADAIEALLACVEASLNEPWSVARMARQAETPRRAFAAEFKEAKGMPVHQYLLRMRADRAVKLLSTTDLPIAEVAVQAGFAHQAHMTRVLNRLKRRTPRQIRAGCPHQRPR